MAQAAPGASRAMRAPAVSTRPRPISISYSRPGRSTGTRCAGAPPAGAGATAASGGATGLASKGTSAEKTQVKLERGERVLDDRLMRAVARDHGDVGAPVDGIARLHQRAKRGFRILGPEQGAVRAAPHAAPQHVVLGLEPERDAARGDLRARLVVEESAAAGGDHLRSLAEQARHHAALAGAEIGLAVLFEDLRDRHVGGAFDLAIGVDEGQPEPLGEAAPGRALAAAHQPDDDDGASRQCLDEARRPSVAQANDVVLQEGRGSSHANAIA